jgi:homoserine kinase
MDFYRDNTRTNSQNSQSSLSGSGPVIIVKAPLQSKNNKMAEAANKTGSR